MGRFVILLIKDSLSSEEQDVFFSCMKGHHSCEEHKNFCNVFAPHIVPFIDKGPLSVAVIGSVQFQNQEVVTWNRIQLNDESILKFLRSQTSEKGVIHNSIEDTVLFQDEASYFSEVLHSLADQLPVDGTYNCDIIVCSRILEGKSLRDNMHFAAALYRFRIWHNADISVVRENPDKDALLLDWYEGIDSHLITSSDVSTRNAVLFWRGGLQIGLPETMNSTYLHGFQLELQPSTEARTWSHIMEAERMESVSPMNEGSLIVSSKLEVLDDCDLSTIPPYVMTPIVFHLSLSSSHSVNDQAYQFLQLVKKKPQVAFILRLQYSRTSLPLQKNTKTFEKWKEAAISGNISSLVKYLNTLRCSTKLDNTQSECGKPSNAYDPLLPSPKHHLNFVLTRGDCSNSHSAVAYLLRDVNDINGDFYHSLVTSDVLFTGAEVSKSGEDKVSKAFSGIPHLDVPLNTFTEVIIETQLKVLQDWQNYKKSTYLEDRDVTLNEINDIFGKVQNMAYSKFFQNTVSQEANSNLDSVVVTSEPVDPPDWPERNFLLQKQISADKNKKYNSLDTLGGLAPPAPQGNVVTVSASDMMNYFTSSGEAKNLPLDVIGVLSKLKMKDEIVWYIPVEETLQLKWPDVLRSKCHDMYYNHSNYCEDLEAKCNTIKTRLVVSETASTCNSLQLSSNFTVLCDHGDMNLKDNQLPQNIPTQGAGRGKKRKHTVSENIHVKQKDSEFWNKKLCLSIQMNSSTSVEELQQIREAQPNDNYRHLYSNADVQFRRSPRKLVRVNYRQSPSRMKSRNAEGVKAHVASDDLSEKHKMKLREAVAVALEQYAITLDHPAFKPCGKKLFAVCKAFVKDVIGKGSTSSQMKKIAQAHAKQVIEFEMQKGSFL